jgi:glucose-6-phosphate isomerase
MGRKLKQETKNSAFNVGLTPIGLIGPKDQHSFFTIII